MVLGVALTRDGLRPASIGTLITISLAGDFCGTYTIGTFADRWGRRKTLCVLALLMASTGALFELTRVYPLLLVAAFFGTLGTSASETAPFLPIEQAILAQVGSSTDRIGLFSRYNLSASFAGAAGALAAGLPDLLTHAGLSLDAGLRSMFGLYAAIALVVAVLVLRLSPSVEATDPQAPTRDKRLSLVHRPMPSLTASRRIVLRLSALFSVDALAGGLVVQSLVVLYFHLRFGVPLTPLAVLFFGANTLSALSFVAATRLARRFGLLNTMVFTHLPSNLLLILIAFMPTFPLAAIVLLVRQALSQMDVPTRQAYTMALVAPAERTAPPASLPWLVVGGRPRVPSLAVFSCKVLHSRWACRL